VEGTYLQKIEAQEYRSCQTCQAPSKIVEYQLLECRQRQVQQRTLHRDLENNPEDRFFRDQQKVPNQSLTEIYSHNRNRKQEKEEALNYRTNSKRQQVEDRSSRGREAVEAG
jgi:hypothetical protein